MSICKIGVAGAGTMGTGITQANLQNGFEVILFDVSEDILLKSVSKIESFFNKAVQKGKMTEEDKYEAMSRVRTTTDLNELAEVDLVIEAIIEKLEVKLDLFAKLDGICSDRTIFGSNTSTMSITKLANATKRPERFAGIHFFNPAPVMKLVEIIRGYYTDDETVEVVKEYVKGLKKEGIEVKKDSPGFVVNRLMLPQIREAYLLLEEGVASIEDIDKAMTLGLNHPMGPFTLMDFTGVDIGLYSLEYLHEEFGQPNWAPPTILKRLINAGRLGKKTGKGWYDYE